jgi:hypothetical protein
MNKAMTRSQSEVASYATIELRILMHILQVTLCIPVPKLALFCMNWPAFSLPENHLPCDASIRRTRLIGALGDVPTDAPPRNRNAA